MNNSLQLLEQGRPLDEVSKVAESELAAARESDDDAVVATIRFVLQLVANLKGRTYAPGSFDDDRFDESECLTAIDDAGFEPGIAAALVMKRSPHSPSATTRQRSKRHRQRVPRHRKPARWKRRITSIMH
jgi:hypothetical protein